MDYRKKFRVNPGEKLRLNKLDPSFTGKHESEDDAKEETEHYPRKLAHQQALLYAEHKHSILIVLQAMDAGGKDGTIKHVFSGRSTRKACTSRASSSRPPPNSRMTSSGASIPTRRDGGKSRSSTVRTTRTCW